MADIDKFIRVKNKISTYNINLKLGVNNICII